MRRWQASKRSVRSGIARSSDCASRAQAARTPAFTRARARVHAAAFARRATVRARSSASGAAAAYALFSALTASPMVPLGARPACVISCTRGSACGVSHARCSGVSPLSSRARSDAPAFTSSAATT